MLITVAIVAWLFWKKSMSKRSAMTVLAGSVVIAGFLQWGFLDTTIYLHQVLYGIVNGGINSTQAFKVVLILASSLVLGRLFRGYICPLGAAQELVSKLVKKQAHIDVKLSEAIRAVFFVTFIVIGIGIASIIHFNPFSLVSPWLGTFKLLVLIIIVAITGLGNFAIPSYALATTIRILRFLFIFAGCLAGFYGIAACMTVVILSLCDLKSFGVPFLSPIAPRTRRSTDLFLRRPIWKQKERPDYLNVSDRYRQPSDARGWKKRAGGSDNA
jgi:uncharacterized membrane protein SirB2